MKKVLIITYYFPPSNDVAVHRILRIGKWLPRYGWEPVILTPDYTFTERVDDDNLKFVGKYFRNVYRCSGTLEKTLVSIADKRKRNILARLIRWQLLYKLNPDMSILWMRKAVSEGLRIIEEQKIDAIWATIGPPTTGLIGAELKKKSNVPLLIDYRDPWTLNPYLKYTRERLQRNIELEQEMLSQADTVIATSESIKDTLVNNGYSDPGNTFVITNGFDEELQWIRNDVEETVLDKNKFHITYAGAFYGDRQPFSFIDGIKYLVEEYPQYKKIIKFNIVGNKDPSGKIKEYFQNAGLDGILSETGLVSYRSAMQYLKQSDLLLLVNGRNPESKIFIPGKLFDYMAVRKPILFIGEGEPAAIITETGIGLSVPHDPILIAKSLLKFINKNIIVSGVKSDKLINYGSDKVSGKLAILLHKL